MGKSSSQWQPLSMLSDFSRMIERMLKYSQMYLRAMKDVEQDPTLINDEILARTFRLCTEQLDDHKLFEEQLSRWKKESLTEDQANELDYVEKQTLALKGSNEEILTITEFIEQTYSNKRNETDDTELRLDAVTGEFKLTI